MTAPDQPTEHAADQLLTAPKSPADDLRQQLADALNTATWGDPISYAAHRDHGFYGKCGICTDDLPAIAQVCAAVVQPVLDTKDAEIKRLNEEIDGFCEDLNDALNHNDETCEAVKDRDRWRQRAEDAERRVANLQATLTEVTSNNDRMRAELDVFRAIGHHTMQTPQIGDLP